LNAKAIIVNQT